MQKQHTDLYRKLLLRRQLLPHVGVGAAYLPFIGDGDIASELYGGGRHLYGADIDRARVAVARQRLGGEIVVADCNGWPFPGLKEPFALADFDAYSEPYPAFRAFWAEAVKAATLVLFLTDGHRQGIIRTGHWHQPDGSKEYLTSVTERRRRFNFYFQRYVRPWFDSFVAPWRATLVRFYLRGGMLYWGAVVKRG